MNTLCTNKIRVFFLPKLRLMFARKRSFIYLFIFWGEGAD